MRKHHSENEHIKRSYFAYLTEAKRLSEKSVDQIAAALAAFEASTGYKDFKRFHIEQAKKFKRALGEQVNPEPGKHLAIATVHSRLMALKAFFQWLAGRPGYRKISYGDAEYFNPSANDTRIASATREKPAPSLEQIRHVLASMPTTTDIDRRNRAMIAFAILSGARDDAIASLSIRHVDLVARTVFQDARSVRTKFRKTFTSNFFPVGEEIEAIVAEWIAHLKTALLFGPDDPLFPMTLVGIGASGGFEVMGLKREHWTSAAPIRKAFSEAFTAAGLPYFNPHSFRDTLTRLGETTCTSPEAFKAWSQNLGHEKVLTTFTSYGSVSSHRQAEIFAGMRGGNSALNSTSQASDLEALKRLVARMEG
jgi:integrase